MTAKPLTLAQAAEAYERTKRAIAPLEAENKAAAEVLKEWFRRTGNAAYKRRIGYSLSTYDRLDTQAVKAHLGKELARFQIQTSRETLSLLQSE